MAYKYNIRYTHREIHEYVRIFSILYLLKHNFYFVRWIIRSNVFELFNIFLKDT